MIRFNCPNCGKRLKAPDEGAGQRTKCPTCGTRLLVPAAAAVPPPVAKPPRRVPQPAFHEDDEPEEDESLLAPAHGHGHEEGIDMTAMVDIVFFLLIFFLVTSLTAIQASLAMPTPEAKTGTVASPKLQDLEQDDNNVVVRIDADNAIWVEDREVTKMELVPRLREIRERGGTKGGPTAMLVLAHGDALHETVVAALDAASEVGMTSVRLSSQEDE